MARKYYKDRMNKKIFTIIFLVLLGCSEAPVIKNEPAGRIVLAEFFTFARCVYCPYAEDALDSLSKEFGDSLAIIAYHRRMLGDTLSPSYVAVRESLYSIQTSPIVVFDGLYKVQTENPDDNYPVFKNHIINRRTELTPLKMDCETSVSSSLVNVKIHIVTVDSIRGTYHLFLILTEDSVYFKQAGAPDSIFFFVMRKMVPNENGIEINLNHPDSIVQELDFALNPAWQDDRLGIVAFVQDTTTKEILQAKVKKGILK